MTTKPDAHPSQKFASKLLPWVIAAGALLLYVLTLNHWLSFSNLAQVARAEGWAWQPDLFGPLAWLVTYAFHWFPAKSVPLVLNLFSAVCGALTLALLARSVALLPHDRTEEQRIREKSPSSFLSMPLAWVPPLFATLICGLQLTFWERATTASGWNYPAAFPMASNQMLDLLLFAYVIRCVLEFRRGEKESWLTRAAVVYGLSMTNDWAMIGFFPAFLVVLVWVRGLAFFNLRFLLRMFLCGLAGLSLYLLLPLVNSLANISRVPFWSSLHSYLQFQQLVLSALPFNKYAVFKGDSPLWVLALPSLLPLLVISIRWPSYFGDPSKLGVALTTSIFHLFHGLLLVVCLWVALDPRFSPRHQPILNSAGLPGLPFYYLGV